MKLYVLKGVLFYLVLLVMFFFVLGVGIVGFSIFRTLLDPLYYDRYGIPIDVIYRFILGIISFVVGGIGSGYLAYLPIKYLNEKTNFFKNLTS